MECEKFTKAGAGLCVDCSESVRVHHKSSKSNRLLMTLSHVGSKVRLTTLLSVSVSNTTVTAITGCSLVTAISNELECELV